MDEVARPYFSDLIGSGTYQRLLQWSSSHDKEIHLSDPIDYYYPSRALKGYSEVQRGKRAFRDTARFISENTYPSLEEALKKHGSGDEVWCVYFTLSGSRWEKRNNGIILDRDPTVGMGFGAAMSRQFRIVSADAGDIASLFNTISPEVWLALSQQIENGTVLNNIEASIDPI